MQAHTCAVCSKDWMDRKRMRLKNRKRSRRLLVKKQSVEVPKLQVIPGYFSVPVSTGRFHPFEVSAPEMPRVPGLQYFRRKQMWNSSLICCEAAKLLVLTR